FATLKLKEYSGINLSDLQRKQASAGERVIKIKVCKWQVSSRVRSTRELHRPAPLLTNYF
ncbi:MAG: hypothetical protein KAW86_01505, partial [Bacteroidales bacterium]|nr:hypothetical protein [Bacteroidales bacterium]